MAVRMSLCGAPFPHLHGRPLRKVFPATATAARVERFRRRFASDHALRIGALPKHAFACC